MLSVVTLIVANKPIMLSVPMLILANKSFMLSLFVSASVSPGMFSGVGFRKSNEMWLPHVYAVPPKKPTPFSIDDILQVRYSWAQ